MSKHPWQVEGVPWKTEASYWSWVRGILRKGWSRHPVKIQFINKHRKQVPNPNPDGNKPTVWGMTCNNCKEDFPNNIPKATKDRILAKHGIKVVTIEINHKNAASSLRSKEDLGNFASKLFYVTFDDLEPLCKPCHDIFSYMEKNYVTYEEAKIMKEAVGICNVKGDDKKWLLDNGITPESNAAKRRKQIENKLRSDV